MNRRYLSRAALLLTFSALSAQAYAHEEHRQLGPHEHGHGELNIVIEGNKVGVELHSPGMDLVGFEHEPSTPEEAATFEAAKKDLETNLLGLIKLPEAAGCTVDSAKIEVVAEEHKGEDGHDHKADGQGSVGAEKEEDGHHNEFQAAYELACTDPATLTSIDFPYFERFKAAKELKVTIVDNGVQTASEVEREAPQLTR